MTLHAEPSGMHQVQYLLLAYYICVASFDHLVDPLVMRLPLGAESISTCRCVASDVWLLTHATTRHTTSGSTGMSARRRSTFGR